MDGIAQRIKAGQNIHWHRLIAWPHIGHRYGEVFGKGTRPIHTHTDRIDTQVPLSGTTITTVTTDDVSFP